VTLLLTCGLLLGQALVEGPERLITREKVEALRKTVEWEVVDYSLSPFLGWTLEEARQLLTSMTPLEAFAADAPLPSPSQARQATAAELATDQPSDQMDWSSASCVHEAQDQGSCSSCWAFALAGMLSDRCCLHSQDRGWLSAQELLSCDDKNYGCGGGWALTAMDYIKAHKGLVSSACFPYVAKTLPCPGKCKDGSDWSAAHVCGCQDVQQCIGVDSIKTCLKNGPVVLTMEVCQSFYYYSKGTYKCDCRDVLGLQSVNVYGYADKPDCHWYARNSWGLAWGRMGRFNISCSSCGIEGKYLKGNIVCNHVG
jgi:C1A family cysteine protease